MSGSRPTGAPVSNGYANTTSAGPPQPFYQEPSAPPADSHAPPGSKVATFACPFVRLTAEVTGGAYEPDSTTIAEAEADPALGIYCALSYNCRFERQCHVQRMGVGESEQ